LAAKIHGRNGKGKPARFFVAAFEKKRGSQQKIYKKRERRGRDSKKGYIMTNIQSRGKARVRGGA
jgi:hypothetical protein